MKKLLLLSFFFLSIGLFAQLTSVASFGTNPGNLNMYKYVPSGITGPAPLVVVMHGCTQNAQQAADQTGWNKLADLHKFYVLYPEQKAANNAQSCFNWFQTADQDKNQGENLSIKQMVDQMKASHSIDDSKVFATGLSAGAAMTEVVCATYPEVYTAGAVFAGGPYKSATNVFEASAAMNGTTTKTPAQWASLITAQNPAYFGLWPKMVFFHGTSDPVVNINNLTESVKQWTQINATDQIPEATVPNYSGNLAVTMASYRTPMGAEMVRTYSISGFGHAIPLDTGSCAQQGGQTATYAYDINFHSTWHAAHFFGLIDTTASALMISGPTLVNVNQSSVSYSVTPSGNSVYSWSPPENGSMAGSQGTNNAFINFGNNSGLITVYSSDLAGCLVGPEEVWVNVCACASLVDQSNNGSVSIGALDNKVLVVRSSKGELDHVRVFDLLGKEIFRQNTSGESVSLQLPESVQEGVYIVQVCGKGILLNKKIIIR